MAMSPPPPKLGPGDRTRSTRFVAGSIRAMNPPSGVPVSTDIHGRSSIINGRYPWPPRSSVATTRFDAGSVRVIRLPAEQLVIQTALVPTPMPPHATTGYGMRIVAWTTSVTGLIRATVALFGTSTQMLPSPLASQFGPLAPLRPTLTVATTLLVAGSIRTTVPSWVSATHTPASVARTPFGADATGIASTTLSVAGSARS